MKTVAISKLVPGQQYTVDGKVLTFMGTRFHCCRLVDKKPVAFSYAAFGDRWLFVDSNLTEVEFKKGYNLAKKPGLVPAKGELVVEKTLKIVA